KVDVGGLEEEMLLEYLLFLSRRPDVRAAMGAAARRYVATQHTLEGAARSYLTFLAHLTGQPVDLSALPAGGQWSVVSGQWSVVSGQWSVVSGQPSAVSRQEPALSPQPSALSPDQAPLAVLAGAAAE